MKDAIRNELIAHQTAGSLLEGIFELASRQLFTNKDLLIQTLAELHNEGFVDVLTHLNPEQLSQLETHIFFSGQQIYIDLIPRLETSAESLVKSVTALVQRGGGDMLANRPIGALHQWCSLSVNRSSQLLDLVDARIPNADRFLGIAIALGARIDRIHYTGRAFEFLRTGSDIEKRGSLSAISEIAFTSDEEWDGLAAILEEFAKTETDDLLLSSLLHTLGLKFATIPTHFTGRFNELATAVICVKGSSILYTAADLICSELQYLPRQFLAASLVAFSSMDATQKNLVSMVDLALACLVKAGYAEIVRSLLAGFLQRENDRIKIKEFRSTCDEVTRAEGNVRDDWIVTWLLDGNINLCSAIAPGFLGHEEASKILCIDFSRYDLRPADYLYLARKSIGAFFIHPSLMASLVVSLMRSAPADQMGSLTDLLFDPVLLNYSGMAANYLESIAADTSDEISMYVATSLDAAKTYRTRLQSVKKIPELSPTPRQQQMAWQQQNDMMIAAYEQGRKNSILNLIATERSALYGNGTVSWMGFGPELQRFEMEFNSFEHSMEIPRLEIWDPIGLQMMLMYFRQEVRPQ